MDDKPHETKKTGMQKFLFLLKVLEIRLRFVVVLVVTALVVGYWDTIQNYWERWTRQAHQHTAQEESEIEYTCGMHPFVKRNAPGKCPICGMDLIPRKKGEAVQLPEGTLARVQISPERIMQAGVQVEPVEYRLLSKTVRSYGLVEVDETKAARIALRFPGRIDELMVDQVGAEVKQGDPLAKVYSPAFLAVTQEYVHALGAQAKADADATASDETKKFAASLVDSTRRRLRLAGFTTEQLDALGKDSQPQDHIVFYSPLSGVVVEKNVLRGDTLAEGTTLYTVADLSRLWVQAQIVEADLDAVRVGMPVEVTSVARPGVIFYGNVDLIYPTVNNENRSVKARLSIANKDGKLKPGMFVNAVVRAPVGRYGEIGSKSEPKMEAGDQAEAATSRYPLDYCVVSGAKLGEMGDPIQYKYKGRDLKFCCEGCVPKFEKEPEKFLKLLDEAAKKAAGKNESSRWVEGYACPMHPDMLQAEGGVCKICGCGMQTTKWRVEKVPSIPETAVIDTGIRQIVYVETLPGVYDARAVVLGPRSGTYYPVLSGIKLGDRIVSRGSFLIDAEARLNPSAVAGAAPAASTPAGLEQGAVKKDDKAKPAAVHNH